MDRGSSSGHYTGKLCRQQRCRGPDHPSSNIGREALAGAPQVSRKYARQVVAPEAELRDSQQPCCKNAALQKKQIAGSRKNEYQRDQNQSRDLKESQQLSPAEDLCHQQSEYKTPGQATQFLNELDRSRYLLLLRPGQIPYAWQARNDLGELLNRAECHRKAGRDHQGRHQRCPAELGFEYSGNARPLEGSLELLLLPGR